MRRAIQKRTVSVQGALEGFSRLELGLLRRRDPDCGAGLGIPTLTGRPVRDGKTSKADETNLIAALKRLGDGAEHTFRGFRGFGR